jgi:hypothetical protein
VKPNLEDLRNHYKSLGDEKLIDLATLEARDLHEEAVGILREEILSRNLSKEILTGIDIQLNPISEKTFNDYCTLIQLQPCPICGSREHQLNAAVVEEVKSIVVVTTYEKVVKIGCPNCLKGQLDHTSPAIGLSLSGIYRALKASSNNDKMKKSLDNGTPNDVLKSFVWNNIGAIEANKDDPEGLKHLMTYIKK